jgi:transglutaminase-like putative cysteine protease
MKAHLRSFVTGLALAGLAHIGSLAVVSAAPAPLRFQAHHEATIRDIPAGAKKARIWLVVPREDPAQRTGEIKLTGPGKSAVEKGGTYDNRFAYFEVENPGPMLKVAADFTVERREVRVNVDPQAARPLQERDRARFQEELKANQYVPVNEKYEKLAREAVGAEQNPVLQARKIYDWVLGYVEYWVKDPQRLKASANGESDYCLTTKTGNCTDFHSLYASLTRAIGIPTRLVYGSFFQGENTPIPNKASLDGKDTDASYHCWIEFYARGVGWVPLDVALADLLPSPAEQQWYFGNLDARRVTWSYGRDLILAPKQDAGPVNAMHKVYVEIDGKPHTAWDRKFTYTTMGAR